MNEDIIKRRILEETLKNDISDDDVLIVDNAETGTAKIPAKLLDSRKVIDDLKELLYKASVIHDYSDRLTNMGYLDTYGDIQDISSQWRYSDSIQIPSNVKAKQRFLFVRARLQRNGTTFVSGIVFYQGSYTLKNTVSIDHDTSDKGEVCLLLVPIPKEATSFRLCSHSPSESGYVAYILDGKECISDDSMETITNGVILNALEYVGSQNGYLDTLGVFHLNENIGWSTSEYIDVSHYNTARCLLKGLNATCVLALYDKNKEFIRGVIPDATGQNYAFVSGDHDITDASFLRICFRIITTDESDSPVTCTLYNRSYQEVRKDWQGIYHTVNKPYTFNNKKAIFCGDSITAGFTSGSTTTSNGYPKLFSDSVGMTFVNKGVGGASIARVSGYGCIQDQVTEINDIGSVDYIFVAGGVNDWQLAVPLSDFKSAVTSICDWLQSHYSKEVIFILPINEAGRNPIRQPVANLDDYRKIIYEVALRYEYSVINGALFNFPTRDNSSDYIADMFGDRLHPSEKGYRLYAKMLRTILE